MPAAVLILFGSGADTGILIGRRSMDPLEWLSVVSLLLTGSAILWPIGRELVVRTEEKK